MFNSNKLEHKNKSCAICYLKQNKTPTEQFRTWLVAGFQASERHFQGPEVPKVRQR